MSIYTTYNKDISNFTYISYWPASWKLKNSFGPLLRLRRVSTCCRTLSTTFPGSFMAPLRWRFFGTSTDDRKRKRMIRTEVHFLISRLLGFRAHLLRSSSTGHSQMSHKCKDLSILGSEVHQHESGRCQNQRLPLVKILSFKKPVASFALRDERSPGMDRELAPPPQSGRRCFSILFQKSLLVDVDHRHATRFLKLLSPLVNRNQLCRNHFSSSQRFSP